jgi:hypothetical protein
LAVRQLRDAYEDLAEGQKRLNVVSNAAFAQERRVISSAPATAGRPRPEPHESLTKKSLESTALGADPVQQHSETPHTEKVSFSSSPLTEPVVHMHAQLEPQYPQRPQPPAGRPRLINANNGNRKIKLSAETVVVGSALEDDKPLSRAVNGKKVISGQTKPQVSGSHVATFITSNAVSSVDSSNV